MESNSNSGGFSFSQDFSHGFSQQSFGGDSTWCSDSQSLSGQASSYPREGGSQPITGLALSFPRESGSQPFTGHALSYPRERSFIICEQIYNKKGNRKLRVCLVVPQST